MTANSQAPHNTNGSAKVTWWILGALFTVLLLVIGSSFTFVVNEVARIGQLQAVRGERITKVEGQIVNLELRVQKNMESIDQIYRVVYARRDFPELK